MQTRNYEYSNFLIQNNTDLTTLEDFCRASGLLNIGMISQTLHIQYYCLFSVNSIEIGSLRPPTIVKSNHLYYDIPYLRNSFNSILEPQFQRGIQNLVFYRFTPIVKMGGIGLSSKKEIFINKKKPRLPLSQKCQ